MSDTSPAVGSVAGVAIGSPKTFAIRIALLITLSPFAIDTYLPAIPAMAAFYGASVQAVATSISAYLIGYAIGQLIGGPVSDRVGRRLVGLIGVAVFFLASLGLVFSQTVEQLLVLRGIQALGGGWAVVIVSAMVRDCFDGRESARVLSMVSMAMMVAPLSAPLLGAWLLALLGWQAIFAFLAAYAALLLVAMLFLMPETRPKHARRKVPLRRILADYWQVLTHRQAMTYILVIVFGFSTMLIFLTESAFLYIETFGVSAGHFPYLFGANILMMMACNRLNIHLLATYAPRQLVWLGVLMQVVGTGCFVLLWWLGNPSLWLVVPCIVVSVGSLGFLAPNATSLALSYFPDTSGTANALIGALEFTVAGALGALLAGVPHEDLAPVALGMAGCAFAGAFVLALFGRKAGTHEV